MRPGLRTVVLAGRRPDAPGAAPARFPATAVPEVAARLGALLAAERAEALVASGACGADLLAHAAAGALGLRRRLVLPFPPARFRAASVVDRPPDGWDWGPRFDALAAEAEAAGDLVVLGDAGPAPFAAANEALVVEAGRLAGAGAPLAVVVWEGTPHDPPDHTADFLALARARHLRVVEVSTRP